MTEWQPIETAPTDTPILVNMPGGHRGLDSCEVVVMYRDNGQNVFWTNGGANAGSDMYFEPDEMPTHWMPIPAAPRPGIIEPALPFFDGMFDITPDGLVFEGTIYNPDGTKADSSDSGQT